MKKFVIFNIWKPPVEFLDFIKSLGYNDYKSFECRFDERVVKFVEDHTDWTVEFNGKKTNLYKGQKDSSFRVGFCGTAHIVEVDTSKHWRIAEASVPVIGFPIIEYIDVEINEFNHISIKKRNK